MVGKLLLFLAIITPGSGIFSSRPVAAPFGLFSDRKDFFQEITGVSEDSFRSYSSDLKNKFYLEKIKPNAGVYSECTIKELRDKAKNIESFSGEGYFKVLYDKPVQEFFNDETFDGAVFQSASDVTGLEGGIVYDHEKLNNMQYRTEQGETVAFCTLYGNIERKYFKPRINLLDSIPGFKVVGENIVEIPSQLNESDFLNHKIGYQRGTLVTYEADPELKTAKGFPALVKKEGDMRVDQAISYSMNLHSPYAKKLMQVHGKNHVMRIAEQLVKKTYEGAILAEFVNGRKKIVLTLVGAGVYGNPVEWDLEAIEDMMPFMIEKNIQFYVDVLDDHLKPKIDLLVKKYKKMAESK